MELYMRHQEINNFHDLTQDFLWGLQNKYDAITMEKYIQQVSKDFCFEIDWDEGIENWAALHGKKNTDFILISCLIPFGFVHKSLYSKFKTTESFRVCFFDDYHMDKVFLSKEVMEDLFHIPEGYYDFKKAHTISDFIYATYT